MLKIIYYSHFHSIISYGIIFWGHSAPSTRVFRLQKRIIRIMTGSRSRESCRKLFTSLKILPFPSLHIFSFLWFVIKNRELFTTNNETHNFYCCTMHFDDSVTFIHQLMHLYIYYQSLKHFVYLIAPTCFDTLRVIIRELYFPG
jgi:hypothetical protein